MRRREEGDLGVGVLKVAELVVLADDVLLVLLFALLLGLGRTLAFVVGVLLQPAAAHDKNTRYEE